MKQVVLVDAKNALYRMHFAPSMIHLSREDGFPTGAIYGCLNHVLLGVHSRLPDAAIVWCWDGLGETWRHRLMSSNPPIEVNKVEEREEDEYSDYQAKMVQDTLSYFGSSIVKPKKKVRAKVHGYKANREWTPQKHKTKYPTEEKARAIIQIPIIKLILDGIGVRQFEIKALECDDLIGILTHKIMEMDEECEVIIFSGDRDFYQLLQYEQVSIVKNIKDGKLQTVSEADVWNEFGVEVKDWTKFRAWTGDSTDNIGHIYKVGKVTARKMLEAGLDQSVKDFTDLHTSILGGDDTDTLNRFRKYFEPHGIEKMWPMVHNNYKLCELVTSEDSPLLSDEVSSSLHKTLKYIKSTRDLGCDKSKRTQEMYRKLTFLLSQYELASILARRDELWQIP